MIDIVSRENAHLYAQELEEMFRLRHRFFVDKMGWTGLRKLDGLERDQFDTDDTIYLLLIEDGAVVGSHRAMPTMKAHMFSEIFPHLCDVRGVQRAPDIYEAGRTCIEEDAFSPDRLRQVRQLMMAGLFEFCSRAGIRQFTCLCPLGIVQKYLRIGVDVKPLGVPTEIDGVICVAAAFPTSKSDVARVHDAFDIREPIVRYIGTPEPGMPDVLPGIWDQPSRRYPAAAQHAS